MQISNYLIEEVQLGKFGDFERRLYRITNQETGAVHYKGNRISGTELRNQNSDEMFKEEFQWIVAELENGDENNLESVKGAGFIKLANDGSYPSESK